jgi:hypothetical protein
MLSHCQGSLQKGSHFVIAGRTYPHAVNRRDMFGPVGTHVKAARNQQLYVHNQTDNFTQCQPYTLSRQSLRRCAVWLIAWLEGGWTARSKIVQERYARMCAMRICSQHGSLGNNSCAQGDACESVKTDVLRCGHPGLPASYTPRPATREKAGYGVHPVSCAQSRRAKQCVGEIHTC